MYAGYRGVNRSAQRYNLAVNVVKLSRFNSDISLKLVASHSNMSRSEVVQRLFNTQRVPDNFTTRIQNISTYVTV